MPENGENEGQTMTTKQMNTETETAKAKRAELEEWIQSIEQKSYS
jgi:hypothetical protein